MKLLDRYILSHFTTDFLVAALALLGLVVLGDVAFKADEFLENSGWLELAQSMGQYVLAMVPLLFVGLAPVLTLLAGQLTMSSMAHSRELAAMRACGVSPLRIFLPLIGASFVVAGLTFVIAEVYLPSRSTSVLESLLLAEGRSEEILRRVAADEEGRVFYFERFSPHDGSFHGAWIDRQDPGSGRWLGRLHAQNGHWERDADGGHVVVLYGVTEWREAGEDEDRVLLHSELRLPTPLAAIDVRDPGARVGLISIGELAERIAAGSGQRRQLLFELHRRLAAYLFSHWILLVLALPFAARSGTNGRWLALFQTLVIVGLYLGTQQACTSLGERGQLPPLAAAWFPVALFGSVGVCNLQASTDG